MAQDKRVFTGGMDKDSEPRLIKQGDYRDAKNIRNIASSDGTSGSVENIEGTQEVNYNFIEESETVVEIIEEHVVQETPQVFHYQDLVISQRETKGAFYNFKIWSRVFGAGGGVGGVVSVANGDFSWTGDPNAAGNSLTAVYLLEQFGEGGLSSEDISVQSHDGEFITLHTEVYQGQIIGTNEVLNLDVPFSESFSSQGSDCYIIRFIADVPEVPFTLDFSSIYNTTFVGGSDSPTSLYWSSTVVEPDYLLGWFLISNSSPSLVISSQSGIQELLDGQIVEELVSEDGSPIGDGNNPFSGNGSITEVQMTIVGVNPTTPQDPQNEFKIFSIVENGNGTINAIPFAQDAFNQFESDFNSGDPFEFDGDQTEIAASIHDKLSIPFSTQILVPGSSSATTHTISTLNNNVSTSFSSNTQLGVVRSSNLSATASASDFQNLESYNSLSSFSSYQNSSVNFIDSNSSVSILGDTITLQNPARSSFTRELFFPVPSGGLVKGEVYRIEANISTFSSSGNSIVFQTQDGKNISPEITSTNSSFSFQFEAQDNSDVFKLVVSNDFAEQDTIVMSGVSIRQFTNPESELIVKFRAPYTFDLVFGTDAASVISDYQEGTSQRDLEWFSGVSVNLNQTIQYGSGYDNLIEENANYESQIEELTNTVSSLNAQLDALTQEYNSTISSINAALDLDSSVAVGSYNLINESSSNLTSVLEANDETLTGLTQVLQNNIDDGAYADGYTAGEVAGVASQAETIAGLNADLQEAIEALENAEATVVNATGQNLITNGDFGDENNIAAFPFGMSLTTGSNGWINYNDDSNFGTNAGDNGEDIAIEQLGGNNTIRLGRGISVSSTAITSIAAFNITTQTLNTTEVGKFYRLEFGVKTSVTAGFAGSGGEETSELSYYDGSSWISCGDVSSGDLKIIYYEATGSTFAIKLNQDARQVKLDDFSLQEISANSIQDYQNLLEQSQDAETELLSIQNALNAAAVEVTPTTLEGVQALINLHAEASLNHTNIVNEIGDLITLLDGASFSNSVIQENLDTQILALQDAIQAIVDIDESIAGDSEFNNIADLVNAATAVNNDYTNLTDYLTTFAETVQNIVSTGVSEEFLSEDGYLVDDVSLAAEYATYQIQLNGLGDQIQTLLNSLNSLSQVNNQLNSELESQAQAAQDAANVAQADFDAQLAAASAETAAAVAEQQAAQAALDVIVDALGIASSDEAVTAIEEGFVDSQELQDALDDFDTTNANLVAVNPDIATAQENLTSLINIANDLQSQLNNITPDDGISSTDLYHANQATQEALDYLQTALYSSFETIDLLSANLINNGDFTEDSGEGVLISANHLAVTASIDNESLVFSNPEYLADGGSALTSATVFIDIGVLTQGSYILFYNYSGTGYPTERLYNQTELRNENQTGSGITRTSSNQLNNNKFVTFTITPVNEGNVFQLQILGFNFDGAVDNIKFHKVPDNLTLPSDETTVITNVFETIQQ